jgi:hypothetical protein
MWADTIVKLKTADGKKHLTLAKQPQILMKKLYLQMP